jgi:Protein of unknown function (DUF3716)
MCEEGEECEGCRKGNGMYAQCIRLPSEYGGACGNCKRGDRGARCTCRDLEPGTRDDVDDEPELVKRPESRREGLRAKGDKDGMQEKYSK